MKGLKPILLAAAVICLAGAANADKGGIPNWGNSHHDAPGPLAGAGLPFLAAAVVAGGYRLIRRRQEEKRRSAGEAE